MRQIKYLIPSLLAALIAITATSVFGAKLDTRPVELKTEVVPLKEDGTYTQYAKDEWKPDTRVIEYKTDKEVGYQILEYELRAEGTFMRSYGEGPEAVERSFDWVKISDTATSTP
jgi:hypothetical protein